MKGGAMSFPFLRPPRDFGHWVAFRSSLIFCFFLQMLPLNIRFKIFLGIRLLLWGLKPKIRAKFKRNAALIRSDLTDTEIKTGARQLLKILARSWAMLFEKKPAAAQQIEVLGMQKLLEHHARGEKAILTVAHIGPIDEIFMSLITLFPLSLYIPAEPVRPAWIFRLVTHLRAIRGDVVLEPVVKGGTLNAAARHLREGRIVVLTIDVAGKNSGVLCSVGNGRARFPVGAIKLAIDQKAAIFPFLVSITPSGKLKVVVGQPLELFKTEDAKENIEINLKRLIEEIYAPNIRQCWDMWLRLLWIDMEPLDQKEA